MSTTQLLNPQIFRSRVLRRGVSRNHRDGGFSLIEIMAGMAIIAILALAIAPQFSKYFERAAVENLSTDVTNAALLVDSDHSLSGTMFYTLGAKGDTPATGTVWGSLGTATHGANTTLDASVAAGNTSFTITGTDTSVTHYTVSYTSGVGLQVKRIS